jgi:E3 ubiquitin-protein ligase SIAH1
MDDLSRALDEALWSDLECPVCIQYMVPPINLCTNGHNICSRCRESLQCCPTCRAKFLETRNVALENIARRMKYPCVNRQNGCLELFSIEHIVKHHAGCVYGEIKCPFHLVETCSWNGLKNHLMEHAKAAHKKHFWEGSGFISPHYTWCFWMLFCFGDLFIYYFKKRDSRYYAAVQLIGTSSEASKYKCEFKLIAANGIEEISKTFLVHGYSEDFETIFNSRKCFNLDEGTVKIFFGDKKLNLGVKLYKMQ